MSPTKTPTSSLSGGHATYFSSPRLTVITATATELLVKQVRYRTLARIRRMLSGSVSPESSTITPSHSATLPVEILEMIVVHLIYDTRSLLACSLTCYSWYIVAVPHLHRTLITQTYYLHQERKFKWPRPLRDMYNLGLLPLVRKLHVSGAEFSNHRVFSPGRFSWWTLRHFAALTNVQELGLDYLDVPGFIPRIQQYFGHFLPTVHSLVLREPQGSRRQIIYFIGVFKHLEDLKLIYDEGNSQGEPEPVDDPMLVPPFIPPLRGRLVVTHFTRVGILEDMIDLFGGIRFRHMSLFNVVGTRLLLGACAETLETLQLHPTDPRAVLFIRDFDLSRNKFLRALEVTGRYIFRPLHQAGNPFLYALRTITSHVFAQVTVFFRNYELLNAEHPWREYGILCRLSLGEISVEASALDQQFKVLQEMHKIRGFQLVLCADTWDSVGEYMMGVLKNAVAVEEVKSGFGDTFPEPVVIHSPRGSHCRGMESYAPTYMSWIPL